MGPHHGGTTLGAIYFPPPAAQPRPVLYQRSQPGPRQSAPPRVPFPYLPDMTNNPLHGFESFRFPNQTYANQPTVLHAPKPAAASSPQHARPDDSRPR